MTRNEKFFALGALLWWFSGGSSKAKSSPTGNSSKAKSSPKASSSEPGRPEEAKPEPGEPIDLTPERAPKPPKKKPTPAASPEAAKAAARKSVPQDVQDQAADFAQNMLGFYKSRGIEEPLAAASALVLYFFAGGQDPATIKKLQKMMGVTVSGEYDKETSTFVAANLDMAQDGAVNTLIQKLFAGENPQVAAGEVLLQYIQEARDIETVLPKENIAALQLFMGVQPYSGVFDDATKARLVELGITPTTGEE